MMAFFGVIYVLPIAWSLGVRDGAAIDFVVAAAINAVALDAAIVVDGFAGRLRGRDFAERDAAERDAAGKKHRKAESHLFG